MDPIMPYKTFSSWLKARHGTRIYKVAINAGLGCPNRDGTISRSGCLFCDATESGYAAALEEGQSITEQFERQVKTRRVVDTRPQRYYAYLQAGSNTHGDSDALRRLYEEIRSLPDVVGVSISTRPDAVPNDRLDLIAEIFAGLDVWIELGVQTANDRTLAAMNRNHTFDDVAEAVGRIRSRGMLVCAHVILGLPSETIDDIRRTADRLAELDVDGVKLHPLFVTGGSGLEADWRAGRFVPPGEDEYVNLVVEFLERMPPDVVVQRLYGRGRPEVHLAPDWVLDRNRVRERVIAEFARRESRQGFRVDSRN